MNGRIIREQKKGMGVKGSYLSKFSRLSWYLLEKGGERQWSRKMNLELRFKPYT